MCQFPALIWVNVPDGLDNWPYSFEPQHVTVPSVLIPQVWPYPATTVRSSNVPAGGVA